MGRNQHVVPTNGRWGIKGEGNSKYTSIFDRQSDAINAARQISRNQQSELFIHGTDGEFENETLMAMTHFHQEAKALVFSPL